MPPKKIPQSYENYYDKNSGTPLRPRPLPLLSTNTEKNIKMNLKLERNAQDNKEREEKKKKEEDPVENFQKELQKQGIQQTQRAMNKLFNENESSSDDEEDKNPMAGIEKKAKI